MYFKVSSAAPFLLKGWSLQSVDGLLAAVIITVALTVIREYLAYSLFAEEQIIGLQRELILKNVLTQARRAGLHTINTAFAYTLMLCVMTFNVWLLVLVSISAGFSYLFFRPLIERTCRNTKLRADQPPMIALISCEALSQEYTVQSPTKLNGVEGNEGRFSQETEESDNGEFLITSPRSIEDQNHTDNSDNPTAQTSQPISTLKEVNGVEKGN